MVFSFMILRSQLLELGKLLNIGKGDEEVLQGKIFDLIAQQALEVGFIVLTLKLFCLFFINFTINHN